MEGHFSKTNASKTFWMTLTAIFVIALMLVVSVSPVSAMPNFSGAATGYYGYPTTSIGNVSPDESVTIITYHFPPNRTFTVRMNYFGTLGVGGIEVGTYDTGDGGTQEATFTIPDSLKGEALLAIRFDDGYYYAYDWFNNVEGGSSTYYYGTGGPYTYTYDYNYYYYPAATTSTYSAGLPGMMIQNVIAGKEVKIAFYDIPEDEVYEVLLNHYDTAGASGIEVGKLDTGEDETAVMSFTIPKSLKYDDKIAVRLQTTNGKYYIYDYFVNE